MSILGRKLKDFSPSAKQNLVIFIILLTQHALGLLHIHRSTYYSFYIYKNIFINCSSQIPRDNYFKYLISFLVFFLEFYFRRYFKTQLRRKNEKKRKNRDLKHNIEQFSNQCQMLHIKYLISIQNIQNIVTSEYYYNQVNMN